MLSNLVLDELDRELERRGHRYRFAMQMMGTSTCTASGQVSG